MILKKIHNERGFTLVEMAIVLVIIGLILAAVVKGKDVINSAKQKKFYTTFVKQWELTVASYYDRTGKVLGDGTANGGRSATANGYFDNVNGAVSGHVTAINNALKAVGLSQPVSNVTSNMQYTYTGTYAGSQTITMYLYYLHSHTEGRRKNTLYFINLPTDLAIAMDTMIDGETGANAGSWRRYRDNQGTNWPDASTTPVVMASYTINVP